MFQRLRLKRLEKGPPQFHVHFSREMLASCLWSYGEDALAERALAISDDDLRLVQNIASHYHDPSYPLPVVGQRISGGHVMALAAVTFFEREVRPLAQNRRRPQKTRPAWFEPTVPDIDP